MTTRTDVFSAIPHGNGITRIQSTGSVFCYLIEGERRALLIDTMSGLGNLRLFVESLTRLPVTVACTHGHFDHIGGTVDFPEVWLPSREAIMLPFHLDIDLRCWFEKWIVDARHLSLRFTQDDFSPPGHTLWHTLSDGMRFDLGGRVLTAFAVPGHSAGSVGFFDSATGAFFSGDAGSRSTFLFLRDSTTTLEYLHSLLRLKRTYPNITRWFNGHNYSEMPPTILDDLIRACHDALDGNITGPEFRGSPDIRFVYPIDKHWERTDGGFGNVIVRLSRLR